MALAKNDSPSELKDLPKWQKIEDGGTRITLKRFIGRTEVVTKQELMKRLKKSDSTIRRHITEGMPQHKVSTQRFQVFAIEECKNWIDGNIDQTQSIKKTTSISDADTEDGEEKEEEKLGDQARKLRADADKAELDAKLAKIKLDEAEGRVVVILIKQWQSKRSSIRQTKRMMKRYYLFCLKKKVQAR
jgi:hypothetical protein